MPSTCARVFVVLAATVGLGTSAAPLISIIPEAGGGGATSLASLSSFVRAGDFSEVFVNDTGKRFYDLHFGFANFGTDAGGAGDGFFKSVSSSRAGSSLQFQTLDFSYGNAGVGIASGQRFRITTTGFGDIGAGGGASSLTITPTIGSHTLLPGWNSGPRTTGWMSGRSGTVMRGQTSRSFRRTSRAC